MENDEILWISGERKREDFFVGGREVKYMRVERNAVAKFLRKFNLPANVNLDTIAATCRHGLLTVIVHKIPPPPLPRPKNFDIPVTSDAVACRHDEP